MKFLAYLKKKLAHKVAVAIAPVAPSLPLERVSLEHVHRAQRELDECVRTYHELLQLYDEYCERISSDHVLIIEQEIYESISRIGVARDRLTSTQVVYSLQIVN